MLDAHTIADALCERGWFCATECFDIALINALQAEAVQLQQQGAMQRAGIGRGHTHHLDIQTRSDNIHWLDGSSATQQDYLAQMDALRTTLNRELMLGLFEYEAHFAFYAPGAFYKKHRDSFAGSTSRIVSVVTYLNHDWPPGSGGELRLFADDGEQEMARVLPQAGTAVVFLSERIPHEVLPATRERYSIAGWFRVNTQTEIAIARL